MSSGHRRSGLATGAALAGPKLGRDGSRPAEGHRAPSGRGRCRAGGRIGRRGTRGGYPRVGGEPETISQSCTGSDVAGRIRTAVAEALARRGIRRSRCVHGKSGDGGIDSVGVLRVNLVSFRICFWCKRWSGSVGAKEIREFGGALQGGADKGLFIMTDHFNS